MKHIASLWILCLMFVPGAASPQETGRDFIHEHSVFDITYPVFLDIDSVYRFRDKVVLNYPSRPVNYIVSGGPFTSGFQFECQYIARLSASDLVGVCDSVRSLDLDSLKSRLSSGMREYLDTASALPIVYATIFSRYGNDVDAYVDDLFGKSVVTVKRRLRRFVRNPMRRRMKRDPGFQFVVSRLLYLLWEELGRPVPPVVDGTRLVILRSELSQAASGGLPPLAGFEEE